MVGGIGVTLSGSCLRRYRLATYRCIGSRFAPSFFTSNVRVFGEGYPSLGTLAVTFLTFRGRAPLTCPGVDVIGSAQCPIETLRYVPTTLLLLACGQPT